MRLKWQQVGIKFHHVHDKENACRPLFHSQHSLYSLRKGKLEGTQTVTKAHTSLNCYSPLLNAVASSWRNNLLGNTTAAYLTWSRSHPGDVQYRYTLCFGWSSSFYSDLWFGHSFTCVGNQRVIWQHLIEYDAIRFFACLCSSAVIPLINVNKYLLFMYTVSMKSNSLRPQQDLLEVSSCINDK